MIPKPQRDDEGKVQGEFYPLQKAELMALRKAKLINNAAFVHLALRYENPWCDRKIIVIPKEFGMRWQIPESSVYEAIAKLKEASAINIKSGRITIEWANSQQGESDDSQEEDDSGNPEYFSESRNDSENPEKITESQKKFWKFRKSCLKTLYWQGFHNPSDYSDLFRLYRLSLRSREREFFGIW